MPTLLTSSRGPVRRVRSVVLCSFVLCICCVSCASHEALSVLLYPHSVGAVIAFSPVAASLTLSEWECWRMQTKARFSLCQYGQN